ncbi:hypothetical protein HDU81_000544 [Chytriomyces hyalinus]|nr:hypothetical protein HDU81_000544 [Chytriomyces hyalinus]
MTVPTRPTHTTSGKLVRRDPYRSETVVSDERVGHLAAENRRLSRIISEHKRQIADLSLRLAQVEKLVLPAEREGADFRKQKLPRPDFHHLPTPPPDHSTAVVTNDEVLALIQTSRFSTPMRPKDSISASIKDQSLLDFTWIDLIREKYPQFESNRTASEAARRFFKVHDLQMMRVPVSGGSKFAAICVPEKLRGQFLLHMKAEGVLEAVEMRTDPHISSRDCVLGVAKVEIHGVNVAEPAGFVTNLENISNVVRLDCETRCTSELGESDSIQFDSVAKRPCSGSVMTVRNRDIDEDQESDEEPLLKRPKKRLIASPPRTSENLDQTRNERIFDDERLSHPADPASTPDLPQVNGHSGSNTDTSLNALCSSASKNTRVIVKPEVLKCSRQTCPYECTQAAQLVKHTKERHDSVEVVFQDSPMIYLIHRDQEGYLHCPCNALTTLTARSLKSHAQKCSGTAPTLALTALNGAASPIAIKCSYSCCKSTFTKRSAMHTHVSQHHRSAIVRYMNRNVLVQLDRGIDGQLHCFCGQYSVGTVQSLAVHASKCDGIPKQRVNLERPMQPVADASVIDLSSEDDPNAQESHLMVTGDGEIVLDELGDLVKGLFIDEKYADPLYNVLLRRMVPEYDSLQSETRAAIKEGVRMFLIENNMMDESKIILLDGAQVTYSIPSRLVGLYAEWMYSELKRALQPLCPDKRMAHRSSSINNVALQSQQQPQPSPDSPPMSLKSLLEGIQRMFAQQRLENKMLRDQLVLAKNENKALRVQVQTLTATAEKITDLERRLTEMLSEVNKEDTLGSIHPQSTHPANSSSQQIPSAIASSIQSLVTGVPSIQSVTNEPALPWRDIVLHHIHTFEKAPDLDQYLTARTARFATMHAINRELPPLYSKVKSNVTAIPQSLIPQFIKFLKLPPKPSKSLATQTGASSKSAAVKAASQKSVSPPQFKIPSNERIMTIEPPATISDGSLNVDRCYAWTDIIEVARPLHPASDISASFLSTRLTNFRRRYDLFNVRVGCLFNPGHTVTAIPERMIPEFVDYMMKPPRLTAVSFPRIGSLESVATVEYAAESGVENAAESGVENSAENAALEAVAAAISGMAGSISATMPQDMSERGLKRPRLEDSLGNGQSFASTSIPIGSKEQDTVLSSAGSSRESPFSNTHSEATASETALIEASKMNVDLPNDKAVATPEYAMKVVDDMTAPTGNNLEPSVISLAAPTTTTAVPSISFAAPATTVSNISISIDMAATPGNQNSVRLDVTQSHPISSLVSNALAAPAASNPPKPASPCSAAPTVALSSSMSTPSIQLGNLSPSSNIILKSNSPSLSEGVFKSARKKTMETPTVTSSEIPASVTPIIVPKISTPVTPVFQTTSLNLKTPTPSTPIINWKPKSGPSSGPTSASPMPEIATAKRGSMGTAAVLKASALASKHALVDQLKVKRPASYGSPLAKDANATAVESSKSGKPTEALADQKKFDKLANGGKDDLDIDEALKSLFNDEEGISTSASFLKKPDSDNKEPSSSQPALKRDHERMESLVSASISENSTIKAQLNGKNGKKAAAREPHKNPVGRTSPIADDLGDIALNQPVEPYQRNEGVLYNVLLRKMMDYDEIATDVRKAVKIAVKDFLTEAMPEIGSTLKACEVCLSPGIPGKEGQLTYLIPTIYVSEFCEWIYDELLRVFPGRRIEKISEME